MLGLPPYKEPVVSFFLGFAFAEFCRVCHFKFLNYVFTKNLKISSSFFRIFYFKIFYFFKKKSNSRPVN
jgi:hypothetical protein